ncbi:MAG TPA: 3-isopropylmalate dehydratase [Thermoplasmata archaeon]|nr:3-isopropylmalate dehydratase [Thermoplasmata archaeon]
MKCGRAWVFGDAVDTDVIIPGQYLDDYSPEFLAKHVMEGIDPTFSSRVTKGDIVVAGKYFGIGSSREQAAIALKTAGVGIILAESFARIFFRNAINLGMLPIVCPGCARMFRSGDELCVDVEQGKAFDSKDPKRSLDFKPLSPMISKIYEVGGLVSLLRAEIHQRNR